MMQGGGIRHKPSLALLAFFLIAGCSASAPDLSSPEKNHEAVVRAVNSGNFALWLACFLEGDRIGKEFDSTGRSEFLKRMRIVESKIIKKEQRSATEALLTISETLDKISPDGYKYRIDSICRVKYVRIGKMWRIHSSEEPTHLRIAKSVNGVYVQLDSGS